MSVERLRTGSGESRVSRHLTARLGYAALTFGGLSLALLLISGLTARDWRGPATLPPVGAVPAPSVPAEARNLPYVELDRTGIEVPTTAGALRGWLVTPHGAPTGLPAVVLVAGAGRGTRDRLLPQAEALARGGVVTLIYDKRSAGYSAMRRDYDRLAEDALAALDRLTAESVVDSSRVGLLGVSEGGWVVPTAARRAGDRVSFTVLVSAPLVTPGQQAAWVVDQALVPAPALLRRAAAVGVANGRGLINYLDTDVAPALAENTKPVYAVWGAQDRVVPVAAAVQLLQRTSGSRASVEIVPGAGHRIPLQTGWAERVADWIRRAPASDLQPRGVEPAVDTGLVTLPRVTLLTDARLHVVLAGAAALAVAIRRRRRSEGRDLRS